nr:MAG TPA: chromosome partition protein [Caudoviricetes sp.]
MVIKIKKLITLNFKGILGERVIEFSPTITQILGANKTGKTTVADAFRWCLFGENSEGRSVFGVRTKDADGNVIPDLPHEVTVVLDVDGREVELKRCLLEKWTKKRNSEERELSLPSAYYINGQKYTETDYKEYIKSLCKPSLFMLLSIPSYFPSQPADVQRTQLSKMVEVPTMEEIAQGNDGFVALLEELADTKLEEYLKHVGYQISQIKEELKNFPVRIEEQENNLTAYAEADTDWKRIEGDIAAVDSAIERIDEEIADQSKVVDGEEAVKRTMRTNINKLKAKIQELANAHNTAYQQESYNKNAACSTTKNNVAKIQRAITAEQERKSFAEAELEKIATLTEDFRTRWEATDSEEFAIDESRLVCPTCHRELEAEDKAQRIASMEADFNRHHSQAMASLEEEAKRIKERKAKYEGEIKAAEKKIAELNAKLTEAQQAYEEAMAVEVVSAEERIGADTEIAKLKEEVKQRTAELEQPSENSEAAAKAVAIANLKKDKAELQAKRDGLRDSLNVREIIARTKKRIEHLQEQQKTLNAQLSELEGKEDTAKAFQLANIDALEQRVNQLFSVVTFTMFDRKLNGNITPKCECCIGGVPYNDLNAADRVNAGIDIINAICRHTDTYVPCFIDNVESINDPLPMLSQCIQLIVSRDKSLQIIK